ncbi:MAG: DUF5686 family protein [bacterium]
MRQYTRFFFLLLAILPLFLHAQYKEIKGVVLERSTGAPLAFVNIITPSGIGTATDIDGKFSIPVKRKENTLNLTYVGYEKLVFEIDDPDKLQKIFMVPKRYELEEVEVFPGINPAHRIIDSVVANRDRNNPEKLDAFRYISYDKMIVTVDADSLMIKDTALLDSTERQARKFLEKQDIFIMETVTERLYKSPGLNQEKVLATKVSGFKDPLMAFMISQIQSTSFYEELIRIAGKKYVNPISPGSTRKYFFLIEDTTYSARGDTVFIISFRPMKKTKFDGMKGFLSINTNQWAIQNVKATPANDTTGIVINIEQAYEFIEDHWFPRQLHTDVIFMNFQISAGGDNYRLVGNGRSYLEDITLNPDLKKKEFGYNEVEIEPDATDKKGEFWQEYRTDSLSDREKETYRVIDSIGEAANFDKMANRFQTLLSGKIPLGPLEIDMNKFVHYNDFEGFYLGAGLHTSDKLSTKIKAGGFWGYGLGDKRGKYGVDLTVLVHKRSESRIRLDLYYNVIASGKVQFFDDKFRVWAPENFYTFFVNRMNYTIGGELDYNFKFKPLRDFKWNIGIRAQNKYAYRDYYFTQGGDTTNPMNLFHFRDVMIGFKFSFRERTIETTRGQLSFGSDYPVIWLNYTRGLRGVLDGDFDYDRIDLKVEDQVYFKYIGEFSWQLAAGYIFGEVPISNNYGHKGTHRLITLYAPASFGTMRTNEFFSTRYAALFMTHNFQNLLFDFKRWHPQIMLVTNIAFGSLEHQENHNNIEFKTLEKGYYESGIIIRGMLDLRLLDLGIGTLYRYGPYSFENISDNFAYKFSIFYSF